MGYIYGPKKNESFSFPVGLLTVATGEQAINPTIVAGDWKVSVGGGTFNPLTNTPVVSPEGGRQIIIDLTAAELPGNFTLVQFVDLTGPKEFHDNSWDVHVTNAGSGSGLVLTVTASAFFDSEAVANILGPYLANYLVNTMANWTSGQISQVLAMTATLAAIKAKTDILTFTSTSVQAVVQSFATAAQTDLRTQQYNTWSEAGKTIAELPGVVPYNPTLAQAIAWLIHFTRNGGVQNNTTRTLVDHNGATIATQPVDKNGTSITIGRFV